MNRSKVGSRGAVIGRRHPVVPAVACVLSLSLGLVACAPAGDGEGSQEQGTKPAEVKVSNDGQGTASTTTAVSEDSPDNRPPLAADYIPEMPMLVEGHDEEAVRKELSDFIAQHYAERKVQSVRLMGNGLGETQTGDGTGMWASFLVSFEQGADVGLMLTCTPSAEKPLIYETGRINVGGDEYYDVETGKYWQIPAIPGVEQSRGMSAQEAIGQQQPLSPEEMHALESNPEMQREAILNDWISRGSNPNDFPPELEPYRNEILGH